MVVGLPGDRRNADLEATMRATLSLVDTYILHDLKDDLRGRAPYEVPNFLRSLIPADVPCEFTADQQEGIFKAWTHVQRGDRMIILADLVDEAVETLRTLTESIGEDAACITPLMRDSSDER